jgi:TRAP-type mannitol/chloroaromatic compound transport system substrate-binding protein
MKFSKHLFLYLLLALLTACNNEPGTTSQANKTTDNKTWRWKMVTTWPANFPVFQEGAEQFAEDVEKMSNGRLKIHVYAGGELIPPLGVFDAVSQGTVEMGHGSPYYWAGKVPEAQFFSSVPFGLTAKGMHGWLYYGGGLELWREVYAPFNVIPFPMGNTGMQMGGWFNKKINSMADVQGLRMRIPGLGGKVLKKAGGNPVLMAGSEIYTALERGTIDATEWVAPFHDLRLGLNRTARYYYYPGWHEPGTMFELIINTDRWNSLPGGIKQIIETAATATGLRIYAQMEYNNEIALREIMDNPNVELLEFPTGVLNTFQQLTRETLEEEAAANPKFKKVYEAYSQFRDNYSYWSRLEESYQDILRKQ